ncbi:MAG: DNA primase [Isosphaeraceae bacterium]|nr:DNA primase [Isosphaeraceae bacterium]
MPRHSEATLIAIKNAIDIVVLVGEYLTLHRSGSKFKALCPFHDDHNPSLELNPERQSFKCWSCGAGGDVIDFVQRFERVEFPEALRMLAERAGVALDTPEARTTAAGPTRAELLTALDWAARQFAEALAGSPEARAYIERRGITAESVARFGLGYAPEARDWLSARARRAGFGLTVLERAGLIVRNPATRLSRERFRGRLIFPIRDLRGRPIGFGGRILPEVEKKWAEAGKSVAKYLNSPETAVFQKRRHLYAADLARDSARRAGWVAVVEGYTDVIAAHQAGIANCVGTLGTALGDEHILALRRLADRVVLVFDGDEAGQKAADRALELFLGHEVDVGVLSLPVGLDPADFLAEHGGDAFRALVERAVDPLAFALDRAAARFDIASIEGARQAAAWVLAILARVPSAHRAGLDVKVAKALDALSRRLNLPVADLRRSLRELRRPARRASERENRAASELAGTRYVSNNDTPIRVADLDPVDRELVAIALNAPELVSRLITRVTVASLRDAPLRAILRACYDLAAEGKAPSFDLVLSRLDDPAVRALAAGLLLPIDPAPLPSGVRPAAPEARLAQLLATIAERDRQGRLRDLKQVLAETDPAAHPDEHRALLREFLRLSFASNRSTTPRPDPRTKSAS